MLIMRWTVELDLEFFIFGFSLTYKTKFGKYFKYFYKIICWPQSIQHNKFIITNTYLFCLESVRLRADSKLYV